MASYRHDTSIGNELLPPLDARLVGEIRIIQGLVTDDIPGIYLRLEYPLIGQHINADMKEGGMYVVGLQDAENPRRPLGVRAVFVSKNDSVLRYCAIFLN